MPFDPTRHYGLCYLTCLYCQQLLAFTPARVIQGADIGSLAAAEVLVAASALQALNEINNSGNGGNYKPTYLAALAGYAPAVGYPTNKLLGLTSDSAAAAAACAGIITLTSTICDPFNLGLPWPPPVLYPPPPPPPPVPPQYPNWMGDEPVMIGQRRLCDLVLPGTHDSATSDITSSSPVDPYSDLPWTDTLRKIPFLAPVATNILADWSKAQPFGVGSQLSAGIRYFDLRVTNRSGDYWTVHGQYSTRLANVLKDVTTFLTSHSREIILLDFQQLFGIQDHAPLLQLIRQSLGALMASRQTYSPQSTVNNLWGGNARVLVFYGDAATVQANPDLWSRSMTDASKDLTSPWANTDNLSTLQTSLDGYVTNRNLNNFFVLQGQLTPTFLGTILKGVLPGSPGSLAALGAEVTPQVMGWVATWSHRPLNIVIVDWFTAAGDFVGPLIAINLRGTNRHSSLDVDMGDGTIRHVAFDTVGDTYACTVTISIDGSSPVVSQLGRYSTGAFPFGSTIPPGKLELDFIRNSQMVGTGQVTFRRLMPNTGPLQFGAVVAVLPVPGDLPDSVPHGNRFPHSEFQVDDSGGGADTRLFAFDSTRNGDQCTVTMTYPGSGPYSVTLSKSNPVVTFDAGPTARVRPTGTLTLEWPPAGTPLMVFFSGTLHTTRSLTVNRLCVAVLA